MPMGVSIPVHTIVWYVLTYIHSVGFCFAYSTTRVFLVPQMTDKQEKKSAF